MTPADFRDLRESLGLSCARVGNKYGVAPITVSRFERGISAPDRNPAGMKWHPGQAAMWMQGMKARRDMLRARTVRGRP